MRFRSERTLRLPFSFFFEIEEAYKELKIGYLSHGRWCFVQKIK